MRGSCRGYCGILQGSLLTLDEHCLPRCPAPEFTPEVPRAGHIEEHTHTLSAPKVAINDIVALEIRYGRLGAEKGPMSHHKGRKSFRHHAASWDVRWINRGAI